MNSTRLQSLLAKYGRNECSNDEMEELSAWYAQLNAFGEAPPMMHTDEENAIQEKIWRNITQQAGISTQSRGIRLIWKRVAGIAASAAILFAAWGVYQYTTSGSSLTTAEKDASSAMEAALGSTSTFYLSDGTQVKLNAGSKLICAKHFNSQNREVFIEGEAFFDVAKNSNKPFIIHAHKMDIRVLGTTLNVKSYAADKTSEAALVTGSVEVIVQAEKQHRVLLLPKQKIVLLNESKSVDFQLLPVKYQSALQDSGFVVGNLVQNELDSSFVETSWKDDKWEFDDEPLSDIANKLARRYNVTIQIEDASLANKRMTASFENEDLATVLEALRQTQSHPFQYTINNGTVMITK
ncbi:FecR family protein [Chitinophaga skermanii]|uniref:FecR family protein n=1 Tax=Chitinophaga skermanii TaxID=331697 RepID=A0A327QI11_9BACT|nr:FecR domain-containing protein [Chitinophaga skermanii]RAJ04050.1 FecR family protein [Chitinophaga skermanii]